MSTWTSRWYVAPPPNALSPDLRARIADALRDGRSQNQVAREFGVGAATVNRIAAAEGLKYSRPKHAAEALTDYCQAERLKLLNRMFDKAGDLINVVESPQGLQQLAVATAVLIDKRRLEDGEATSRSEVTNADTARGRLAGRLDDLVERRAAKSALERAVG